MLITLHLIALCVCVFVVHCFRKGHTFDRFPDGDYDEIKPAGITRHRHGGQRKEMFYIDSLSHSVQ